jgi:hypothetical protein
MEALAIPIVTGGTERYIMAQLQLKNDGPIDTMTTATLQNPEGDIVWQNKLWVCASCIRTHPFWFKDRAGGVLTVQANEPLTGIIVHREVVTAWPVHGVGLSILALPGYALGQWPGTLQVTAIIGALLATACYGLLRDVGVRRRNALLVAMLLSCSPPLLSYGAQLYPEIVATLLLVVAVRLLGRVAACWQWWRVAGALACISGVPVLHGRLLPLALLLLCSFVPILARHALARSGAGVTRRQVASGAAMLALGAFALALVWQREPRIHPAFLRHYFATDTFAQNSFGVLFDNATGLIPYIPLLLLAGSGYLWAIRQAPYYGIAALALALTQIALIGLRHGGWQVWSPPGRYILPIIPFVGVALGLAWDRGFHRPVRSVAIGLGAWSVAIAALFIWIPVAPTMRQSMPGRPMISSAHFSASIRCGSSPACHSSPSGMVGRSSP